MGRDCEIPMKLQRDISGLKILSTYSQGCLDQEYGEVDLYNHVKVLFLEHPGHIAYGQEDGGGDEHSEDVAHKGPSQGDLHHNRLLPNHRGGAHLDGADKILVEIVRPGVSCN